jgi:hypothetical protein
MAPTRRQAARSDGHHPPRAGPARRPDRHRLLRRLPLRPAHRARRMGRHPVPVRAGPRDRRPRLERRRPRPQLQGRRPGRRRLHGRQLPALRGLRRRPGKLLRRHGRHLQRRHRGRTRPHAGRLCRADRRARALRAARDAPGRAAGRRGAAAVRGHHHVFSAAPLECRPGKTVGVVGIGGLGHMGIKLARAMGAHVVAFTTSESKRQDAEALGAHEVVVSAIRRRWPRVQRRSTSS